MGRLEIAALAMQSLLQSRQSTSRLTDGEVRLLVEDSFMLADEMMYAMYNVSEREDPAQ